MPSLAFLFLASGCATLWALPDIKTLDVKGFERLPLRVAAIVTNESLYYSVSTSHCYYSSGEVNRAGISSSYFRTLSKLTLRRNLPLIFTHVDVLDASPESKTAYNLILHPTASRPVLQGGDPPNHLEVAYTFEFRTPSGRLLLVRTGQGSAAIQPLIPGYTSQSKFPCEKLGPNPYRSFHLAVERALAEGLANAIGDPFTQVEVVNTLRAYAQEVRAP
jgi:hypothetical protein